MQQNAQFAEPTLFTRHTSIENTLTYMGSLTSLLVKAEDTGGRFAFVEALLRKGNEPPPHRHLWEHELYCVLDGLVQFYCEDNVVVARPGDVVFLPQGKAHAFYIRSPLFRAFISVQATGEHAVGFDRYLTDMGEPAESMDLPADAITHATGDPSHAMRIAARNGIVILTPEEATVELPNYPGFGVDRGPL